jgi:cysteinyl-tRNA synthetase
MKENIKFYNTLTRHLDSFKPIEKDTVKIYSCGPTVYDYAHIGNFRSYIFSDLLRRFLKYEGYKVIHTMNLTDVDDKTIRRSNEENMSLKEYTDKYIKVFFEDLETLNIEKVEYYPRATEHINEMIELIKKLDKNGYTYEADGSIYFNISKFKEYGKLSKIDLSGMKSGVRIDVDEYNKEDVRDFVLWKGKKEGEPFWETEYGAGRPGWHIECSAMSSKYLGETFDIHTGGVDLIFPHHENEIAQSECASGKKFVNYWLHCAHLIVNGEKMSKSKGNFYTLRDLLKKGYSPKAIRYLLLSTNIMLSWHLAGSTASRKLFKILFMVRLFWTPGSWILSQHGRCSDFVTLCNLDPPILCILVRLIQDFSIALVLTFWLRNQ